MGTVNVTLVPEIQKAESNFRKVTDKQSPMFGKRRDAASWSYAGFKADSPEAKGLNHAIEQFGRKLLIENGDDWNWLPDIETCNLDKLVEWLETERGGWSRVITKESLDKAGTYYFQAALRILGKEQASAVAGSALIRDRFKPITGNKKACAALLSNIEEIIVLAADSDEESELLAPHAEVFERLIKELNELMQAAAPDDLAL